MQYHDKKKYCWRKSDPTFTEHMEAHFSRGRDTGQYGTGLYCYENLHPAIHLPLGKEFNEEQYEEEVVPLLKLDITTLNLFEPRHELFFLENFSEKLRNLAWHFYDTPTPKRDKKWQQEYIAQRSMLESSVKHLKTLEPTLKHLSISQVDKAIAQTVECLETKSLSVCSQPINKVLHHLGFDGVKPVTDLANKGGWGIVIFKESAHKLPCLLNDFETKTEKQKIKSSCGIGLTDDELEPFLADESQDDYLQLTEKTNVYHRLDFHNRLKITEEMSLEEKEKEINEMHGHCLHWTIVPLGISEEDLKIAQADQKVQCDLIRDFYLKQLKKQK